MNTRRLAVRLLFLVPLALCSCTEGQTPGTSSNGPAPGGVGRVPTFDYAKGKEGGCGNLYLYKGTADKREVLWVSADQKKLKLPDKGSKSFDLATTPDGLLVAVDLWKAAPRFSAYCNDIGPDTKREATWKAKRGKITITILGPEDNVKPKERYKVNARLEGVVFEDEAGHRATLKQETFTDVVVGWYAG